MTEPEILEQPSDLDRILKALDLPEDEWTPQTTPGAGTFLIRAVPLGDERLIAYTRTAGYVDSVAYDKIRDWCRQAQNQIIDRLGTSAGDEARQYIRASFTGLAETIRAEAVVDVDEVNRRRMVGIVALGLLDSKTHRPVFEWTDENLASLRTGNWPFIAEAYGAIMALSIAPSLEDSKSGSADGSGAEAAVPPDDPPPE